MIEEKNKSPLWTFFQVGFGDIVSVWILITCGLLTIDLWRNESTRTFIYKYKYNKHGPVSLNTMLIFEELNEPLVCAFVQFLQVSALCSTKQDEDLSD